MPKLPHPGPHTVGFRHSGAHMLEQMQADEGMSPDQDPAGSVELCIQIGQGGEMSVYKESPGADGQQEEGERQQVSDIGQALAAVLKMYKSMNPGGDAESQFKDGFGPPAPPPPRMVG